MRFAIVVVVSVRGEQAGRFVPLSAKIFGRNMLLRDHHGVAKAIDDAAERNSRLENIVSAASGAHAHAGANKHAFRIIVVRRFIPTVDDADIIVDLSIIKTIIGPYTNAASGTKERRIPIRV